jgi:hypothetical protein
MAHDGESDEDPSQPPQSPKRQRTTVVNLTTTKEVQVSPRPEKRQRPLFAITGNRAGTNQTASAASPDTAEPRSEPCGAPDHFEVNDTTENVNRMLAAIHQGLRPKTKAERERELADQRQNRHLPILLVAAQPPVETPPPTDHEVWNWEDAPLVQPPRSFQVVRVEPVPGFVKAAGVLPSQAQYVECWAIWVKDENSDNEPLEQLFKKLAGAHGELYELLEQARDAVIEATTAAKTEALQEVADAMTEAMAAIAQKRTELSQEKAANIKLSQETAEATEKSLQDVADARAEAMAAITKSFQETAAASAKLSQEMEKWWLDGYRRERQVQEKHDVRLEETTQREAGLQADREQRLQEAIADTRTAAESDHQRRREEFAQAEARMEFVSQELRAQEEKINEMSAKLRQQETQMDEDMFKREAEMEERLYECGNEIETKLEQKFADREAQMKKDMEVASRARAEVDLAWARTGLQNTGDEIEQQRKRDAAQDELGAVEAHGASEAGNAAAAAERLASQRAQTAARRVQEDADIAAEEERMKAEQTRSAEQRDTCKKVLQAKLAEK